MSFTFERYLHSRITARVNPGVRRARQPRVRETREEQQRKLDELCARIPSYKATNWATDIRPDYTPAPLVDEWPELPPSVAMTKLGQRIKAAIDEFEKSHGRPPTVVYMTPDANARLREAVVSLPILVRPELTCPFLVG